MYYHLLTELALNRFSWRGLPPTVDERWLEMCLCEYGCALFFEDKRIGRFLVTQAGYQGRLNVYNNPTCFEPVGVNYHYKQLKAGRECIPIWDNRMRMSFKDILWQYARRLADIDKAYDVNLESLKLQPSSPPTRVPSSPCRTCYNSGRMGRIISSDMIHSTPVACSNRGPTPPHICWTSLSSKNAGD